ncbi:MAG: hypothetical protein ACM3PS_03640 [Syntrophothermus sp.]
MTPRARRLLILAGIILIAAILAIPMRDAIFSVIVVPVAFVGWEMGLLYRMLPQALLWWVLLVVVFFMLVFSALPPLRPVRREVLKPKPRHGQVEDLSIWMGRAKGGVYFKWLVANRLGKLAYQILLLRESGRPRSVFTPLVGEDWKPSKELQSYLETGLHGSFSDFSNARGLLSVQPKTPLDFEVKEAVDFLESQVESSRSGNGSKNRIAPE